MAPSDRYVTETSFYVRYAETDAMRIVHHSSYIIYFEEGRSHYARERGSDYATMETEGYFLAVSEIGARYLKAVRYGQRLTVRCWIDEMKSRALTFKYEIIDADSHELCVTGYSKHICINAAGHVSTLPDSWRMWGP